MNYQTRCLIILSTMLLLLPTDANVKALQQGNKPDDLIKLNVLVLDTQNHPVLDVKQEEMRVLEDGSPQTIVYFSKDELPLNYCIVFDTSGSIRKSMNQNIDAAKAILNNHKLGDEVALTEFSDDPRLLQEFTPNRGLVAAELESLRGSASRQTCLIDAVYVATTYVAEYKPADRNSRRALILITDGDEGHSYYKLDALLKHIERENIQIFVIGFDLNEMAKTSGKSRQKRARDLLSEIAKEAGGLAFFPENKAELQMVANEILSTLRTQYVVGYKPNRDRKKDSYHKVSVTISEIAGREKREGGCLLLCVNRPFPNLMKKLCVCGNALLADFTGSRSLDD